MEKAKTMVCLVMGRDDLKKLDEIGDVLLIKGNRSALIRAAIYWAHRRLVENRKISIVEET